ncbi:molybdopterin-dependent oxidoreductase [Streptomyces sp. NPDC012769]|uniref:molybdopterin-dependent oxidoreductase n=1 Tax=Streptomyces sp. NPDC012769 TaxID=3364848 RepID=UPI0036CA411F
MCPSVIPRGPGATAWSPETVTTDPYNAETPAAALTEPVTPAGALFVRDHFAVPRTAPGAWRLRIDGAVRAPYDIGLDELAALAHREFDVVLECAGNGRTSMTPTPPGLPWGQRAVGCVRFAGVPFRLLAERAGVEPDAVEFVFTGADSGSVHGRPTAFRRSLPLSVALHPDTLLATHQGGAPLTAGHGAPVRLVGPGRFAVADVKWLVGARAVTRPFEGVFQTEEYVYVDARGVPEGPVGPLRVKSLITAPEPDEDLRRGRAAVVRGRAWSGDGVPVRRVEVRTVPEDEPEAGAAAGAAVGWRDAALEEPSGPYAWTGWSLRWTPHSPGRYRVLARATDARGATQPEQAPWNAQGYGCNTVAAVDVVVV